MNTDIYKIIILTLCIALYFTVGKTVSYYTLKTAIRDSKSVHDNGRWYSCYPKNIAQCEQHYIPVSGYYNLCTRNGYDVKDIQIRKLGD